MARSQYTDARLGDFLGETEQGSFDDPYGGARPLVTEEMIQEQKRVRAARAERERLASIPYGTPVSHGGTAAHFTATETVGGPQTYTSSGGAPAVNTTPRNINVAMAAPGSPDPLAQLDTAGEIEADAGRRSDEGDASRTNALQDIIDRYEAVGYDTGQSDQSRVAQQEGIRMNREVYGRASGFDRGAAAARYSENALASSLAVARSAPGAASREEALFNALSSMPALQAEGQAQANEEGRAQDRVALQAAQQLGQQATATRSQDAQQAETLSSIGLDVAKGIANFSGLDLELDQRDREFLGEVALAVARLNLDTERLSSEEAIAAVNAELAREGMDQEWRMFKEGRKISDRDILGGIFQLGGAAIGAFARKGG